jgi:tRNA nucleotidyltransferase (CCA-adding enzyme)
VSYKDLVRLKICDRMANRGRDKNIREYTRLMLGVISEAKKFGLMKKETELVINGVDIMNIFQIGPGLEVGTIKRKLLDIVNENPSLNNREFLINKMHEMR